MKVLVTGGAGFVGSFLCEELHRQGIDVRIFDNFEPQVHGEGPGNLRLLRSADGGFRNGVELVWGDVRSAPQLDAAMKGVDAIVHFAAQVGVGQSMYEIHRYVDHNTAGTAVLLAWAGGLLEAKWLPPSIHLPGRLGAPKAERVKRHTLS